MRWFCNYCMKVIEKDNFIDKNTWAESEEAEPIGWIKVMPSICKLLDRQLLRRLLQYSIS